MRLGRLDMNLLVALNHLLTLRSITKTAHEMHLTQSAMSSALRRLREYFDDPLLVQIGRQMELTPRAESLKEPLRELMFQVDQVLSSGATFDPTQSTRQFKIILSDYSMAVFAPVLLALAEQAGATTRFKFLPQVKAPYAMIDRGDADFLVAPDLLLSPDHPGELLFEDAFLAMVWSGSAHAHAPLTRERYLAAKHAAMVPQNDGFSVQFDFFTKNGVVRDLEVETYNFTSLAPLIVGTQRIATVHGRLARMLAPGLPLTLMPLPFESPRVHEHLQWHRLRSNDQGMLWLRALAVQAGAQLGPPQL